MEFNKIAGAVILSVLMIMVIGKIGNTLVPVYHPPHDKEGAEHAAPPPEQKEPEKPLPELLAAADPKQGERRAAACTACHSFVKGGPNKVGPNLWGVVGRKKGSHEGFAYSDAIKNAKGNWTYEDIFHFVGDPAKVYPGTKMAFRMANAAQRADVLAYLRTLSDSPVPFPAVEKKTEAPKPEEKKPEEKKAEPAKPEQKPAPKAEEKKPEPPKAEPGKSEPPKAEPPKAEPPKAAEEPKKDAPKADEKPAEEKKN
ncbi:MAG: c-type cytochrome [Rhodospirillaceae bacterium]|nr:c-type cytochrome [Rhodospirillaceae bacterium]